MYYHFVENENFQTSQDRLTIENYDISRSEDYIPREPHHNKQTFNLQVRYIDQDLHPLIPRPETIF